MKNYISWEISTKKTNYQGKLDGLLTSSGPDRIVLVLKDRNVLKHWISGLIKLNMIWKFVWIKIHFVNWKISSTKYGEKEKLLSINFILFSITTQTIENAKIQKSYLKNVRSFYGNFTVRYFFGGYEFSSSLHLIVKLSWDSTFTIFNAMIVSKTNFLYDLFTIEFVVITLNKNCTAFEFDFSSVVK